MTPPSRHHDDRAASDDRRRPGPRAPVDPTARRAVEAVWRSESARIVGALARYTRDLALAEDVAQEAVAEALVSWAVDGVPAEPAGWLTTVGRRRAIDAFRRRAAADERYAALARELDTATPGADQLFDPDAIDDDRLALIFTACHPVLSREAQLTLTLKVVGGLTTEEIAHALLLPVATVQARVTRAKKAIGAAGVPFEVPPPAERPGRLSAVLAVVYLVFTEGSSASHGTTWMRTDLADEAIRLARGLAALAPEPEVLALLALLELTAARFPARTGADGAPVLLEDQDRSRWDAAAIRRGRAALATARSAGRGLGYYGLQAAIAECHAVAASVDDTDWQRVVDHYDALARLAPSPVVDLGRAAALAMSSGPAAGLAEVERLERSGALAGSHLLLAVRAGLLARAGQREQARSAYLAAATACGNEAERAALRRQADALA